MWLPYSLDPCLVSVLSKYSEFPSSSSSPSSAEAAPCAASTAAELAGPASPSLRVLILFGSTGGTSAAVAFSLFQSLRDSLLQANDPKGDASLPLEPRQQPRGEPRNEENSCGESRGEGVLRQDGSAPHAEARVCGKKMTRGKGSAASKRGDGAAFGEGARAAEQALKRAEARQAELKNAGADAASDSAAKSPRFLDSACAGDVELYIQSTQFFSFDDLLAIAESRVAPPQASRLPRGGTEASRGNENAEALRDSASNSSSQNASQRATRLGPASPDCASGSLSRPVRLILLFCVSTASQGSPPPAAAAFFADAEEAAADFRVGRNVLSSCFVAGVGCGSSDYPPSTFCRPAKKLFKLLTTQLGARPLALVPVSLEAAAAPGAAAAAAPLASASSLLLLSDTQSNSSLEMKTLKWTREMLQRAATIRQAPPGQAERLAERAASEEARQKGRQKARAEARASLSLAPGEKENVNAPEHSSSSSSSDSEGSSDYSESSSPSSASSSADEEEPDAGAGWQTPDSPFAGGGATAGACGAEADDLEDVIPCGAEGGDEALAPEAAGQAGARGARNGLSGGDPGGRSPAGGSYGVSSGGPATGREKGRLDKRKKMVSEKQAMQLKKEGYKLIGSHSAVKLCRWTKSQLRGRGGCYKHTFYGITSSQCMELTPSLACANKCVFCWRHHKNPVGTSWRWQQDSPDFIVEQGLKKHFEAVKVLKGMAEVKEDRLASARAEVRHCALSLVGEPIMYPRISELVQNLHQQHISTFLVTNAQFPDALQTLPPVTQLYLSVDAANAADLKRLDQPLFADYWERFLSCLELLKEKRQRTVYRLTLVGGYNMEDPTAGDSAAESSCHGSESLAEGTGAASCSCRVPPPQASSTEASTGEHGPREDAERIPAGTHSRRKAPGESLTDRSAAAYANLVLRGSPDLVEVKAVTYAGTSKHSKLTMQNIPWHEQVVTFCKALCDALPAGEYAIACEHRHSCCVLIAKTSYRRNGVWHTWIDYDKFYELANSGNTEFSGLDYCAPTPSWAVYGSVEAGFSPFETRVFSKGKQKRALRDQGQMRSGDASGANGNDDAAKNVAVEE
ncbi:radical SAM domain-containing protein [Besnoitia besnoiti]|uniref:tRNA 4-demethylwyosine synthase (AdoMet-dependent) n=1 Tax=Besnoitia besnoiti TaxID=94643 RepID=A0A2A9MND1_BESBE|nr:radical SAM domain-containing protein [Besnoitia besnoiti]PFH37357.1 radical SAM domain-containing protein [Besnoitia besnoiti]